MDFELINSKLLDAETCLLEMYKQERRAFDSMNVFPKNHDGFLAICATIRGLFDGRGDGKRDAAIKAWKSGWERNLTPDERILYKFMQDESDDTQHVQVLNVQAGNQYPAGTIMGEVPNTKKRYIYNIDGVQRDVTAVCEAYFKLLSRMVAEAKQANL